MQNKNSRKLFLTARHWLGVMGLLLVGTGPGLSQLRIPMKMKEKFEIAFHGSKSPFTFLRNMQ